MDFGEYKVIRDSCAVRFTRHSQELLFSSFTHFLTQASICRGLFYLLGTLNRCLWMIWAASPHRMRTQDMHKNATLHIHMDMIHICHMNGTFSAYLSCVCDFYKVDCSSVGGGCCAVNPLSLIIVAIMSIANGLENLQIGYIHILFQ